MRVRKDGKPYKIRKDRKYSGETRYERAQQALKAWRKRTPDAAHRNNIKFNYGITKEEYNLLLELQGNVCAVCGSKRPPHKHLDVDHDHATDKVRGLLCNACNRALAAVADSTERLRKLIVYLENPNAYSTVGVSSKG